MHSKNTIVTVLLALVVVGIASVWAFGGFNTAVPQDENAPLLPDAEVACTLEAKICPDGSTVGRVPPSCEFAACPGGVIDGSDQWQQATAADAKATFKYPEALPTFYIEAVDWPPEVAVIDEPFACTEAGEATDRAGATERKTINGTAYCVTTVEEGAAGSVYTQYAYALAKEDGEHVILTFSTRATQCGNFDEEQAHACEAERTTFSIDDLADEIAETLIFEDAQ